MGKLVVVVGGQYGSEAKGAVVAHLTRAEPDPPLVVRVGGPNAGHTVYDDAGVRWPLRQIPAGVIRPGTDLAIGQGSVVDYSVLASEVQLLDQAGHKVSDRLFIDAMATVLRPSDKDHEEQSGIIDRIGSTGKGIGIARAGRIMRTQPVVRDVDEIAKLSRNGIGNNIAAIIRSDLAADRTVIVEGTQGFELGLHRWLYPFATSQDCTALDVLAQAAISPWDSFVTSFEVWVVFRTYPIRVAGNSGPMAGEITWEMLSLRTNGYIQPEKTTVTQKVRRVGEWDNWLALQALSANGGSKNPVVHLALMMCDYLDPRFQGLTNPSGALKESLEAEVFKKEKDLGKGFELLGTGPQSIVDRREP